MQQKKMFQDKKAKIYFSFLSNKYLPTKEESLKEILEDNITMIVCKNHFEDRFSPMFSCIANGDEDE